MGGANGEARVEEEDALVGPRSEKTAVLGWGSETGVFLFDGGVDVLERWRSARWWADGEAEAMSLIVSVVGVLS